MATELPEYYWQCRYNIHCDMYLTPEQIRVLLVPLRERFQDALGAHASTCIDTVYINMDLRHQQGSLYIKSDNDVDSNLRMDSPFDDGGHEDLPPVPHGLRRFAACSLTHSNIMRCRASESRMQVYI